MCRHNLLCDFQTLYVEPGLCLCDCPGLVMPSFVSTKAEMICNGILPIDQMRDHVPPVSLISFLLQSTLVIDVSEGSGDFQGTAFKQHSYRH